MKSELSGHLLALFTTTVWGVTYVSTKYLVTSFAPAEILTLRLMAAMLLLKLISPGAKIPFRASTEKYFALAGLTGICMYFLLENTALTITTASNTGVIVAMAPMCTAILAFLVHGDRQVLSPWFIAGFLLSISGVSLLSFRGSDFSIHPAGDLLVLLACCCWAVYSLTIRRISDFGYGSIAVTRRAFLWGLVFMLPALPFSGIDTGDLTRYADPAAIANLLFLGCIASAVCFATWNYAVKIIGPVRTCVYIYAGPAVTVLFAFLFLGEQLNLSGIAGCIMVTAGLVISSVGSGKKPIEHGDNKERKNCGEEKN